MDHPPATTLRVGAWLVEARSGQISRAGETVRLDARALRLLLHLARKSGEVVSIDELLNEVWSGVVVTPDSVYQAVASLRRVLGDDPKQPSYIATVPRLGYRMVATVSTPAEATTDASGDKIASGSRRRAVLMLSAAVAIGSVAAWLVYERVTTTPASAAPRAARSQQSIAVMPFLDLTEAMDQEYFADGMTEELVDKLSSIPGLQVPPARSSFRLKGQGASIADISAALNVAYVLDGSIRQSDDRLRVAARLVRAEDGFIAWSQTYDRPLDDRLMIQEDIATEVARSLRHRVISTDREE
jgi:transcriptional activator of cad operon